MSASVKKSEYRIMLAPVAGYTDRTMRRLCTEMGADMTYTEMISAQALFFGNDKTKKMLSFDDVPEKIGIQLFGRKSDVIAKVAAELEQCYGEMLSAIDINMGCPAPKITGNGEGSFLMKEPGTAAEIVSALKKSVSLPVSVKFRKGFDSESENAVEFARILEDAGADALTVHGRTREQFYSGKVDLDIIRDVKRAVKIPVNGSGDVFSPEDAERMAEYTGCYGVMVARGALGDPFIFREIKQYIETGRYDLPTKEERIETAIRHIRMAAADKGDELAVKEMRKQLSLYIKGMPGCAQTRERLVRAATPSECVDILSEMR